jgi:ADP-ribose pyrophosphatase YjhB (NUDIX family)
VEPSHPLPVVVVLLPVTDGDRTGLLVIRRAVPPGIGKLAFVSGFLESHEPWQQGAAREVREETGVVIDPETLEPLWFASTTPKAHRILLFALAGPIAIDALPPHRDPETLERGVIWGPDGLDDLFVYRFHVEVARRYFAPRGITGGGFSAR